MKIKSFKSKESLLKYVKNKFKDSQLIFISGSTAYKDFKDYSDLDLEVFGKKLKKPYYELVFVNKKIVLVSAYYKIYKKGKKVKPPKNVRVLKGEYNNNTDKVFIPMYGEGKYNNKEKIKRECQLITDFCFKYYRSKDKRYLEYIQKRL